MARSLARLTDVAVRRLAKETPDKTRLHHDGGGLYLAVDKRVARDSNSPAASWIYRYTLDGRAKTMGLGRYPDIKLSDARGLAAKARSLKANGLDPIGTRQAERTARREGEVKALTFKQGAEAYVRSHASGWRNVKHAKQWEATLSTYAYRLIGETPIAQIDNAAVLRVLTQEVAVGMVSARLWDAKPETASRLRGRLEAILGWAAAGGHRSRENNPAQWKGQLEHQLPSRMMVAKPEHHAALPYEEIGAFIAELRTKEGTAARAFEFAILTAARTSEALGARWGEIDLERKLWVIPPARIKARREHRVPLCARAVEILSERAKVAADNPLVFPGEKPGRPLSNMAFLMLLRRMKREDLTAHGMRSTFKDWASETSNFPSEMTELALAHTVSDKVEAAYRRGDQLQKRHELMEAWGAFCDGRSAPK